MDDGAEEGINKRSIWGEGVGPTELPGHGTQGNSDSCEKEEKVELCPIKLFLFVDAKFRGH